MRPSAQRVFGLILVDRAALRRLAGDQGKAVDGEWLGAEQRIGALEVLHIQRRDLLQPRQADMRAVASRVRREADTHHRRLDLVAQMKERGVALDADPKEARRIAAEMPGAGQRPAGAGPAYPGERRGDVARRALVDLADEAQRQMHIAGIDPARALDAGA